MNKNNYNKLHNDSLNELHNDLLNENNKNNINNPTKSNFWIKIKFICSLLFIIGGLFFFNFIYYYLFNPIKYYAVNISYNNSLPNNIFLNDIPCAFRFIDEFIKCTLYYDFNYNVTNIVFYDHNNKNKLFNNGYLFIKYNNYNYNQLLKGYNNNEIYIKSYINGIIIN